MQGQFYTFSITSDISQCVFVHAVTEMAFEGWGHKHKPQADKS